MINKQKEKARLLPDREINDFLEINRIAFKKDHKTELLRLAQKLQLIQGKQNRNIIPQKIKSFENSIHEGTWMPTYILLYESYFQSTKLYFLLDVFWLTIHYCNNNNISLTKAIPGYYSVVEETPYKHTYQPEHIVAERKEKTLYLLFKASISDYLNQSGNLLPMLDCRRSRTHAHNWIDLINNFIEAPTNTPVCNHMGFEANVILATALREIFKEMDYPRELQEVIDMINYHCSYRNYSSIH
jgi:hypothetical protein